MKTLKKKKSSNLSKRGQDLKAANDRASQMAQ